MLRSLVLPAGNWTRFALARPQWHPRAAVDRPVHFAEVLATLYHNIGIDRGVVKLDDFAGRPQYVIEHFDPMPELV